MKNYFKHILSVVLTFTSVFGLQAAVITDVPDKDGATIKGLVKCGDQPLADVQVSDGYIVTKTDANGHYWIASEKQCGYVFVCNPFGYKNSQDGKSPEFYKKVTAGSTKVERADFEMVKETNPNHVVLFMADPQLVNKNNDISQFQTYVIPDFNATASKYKEEGKDVYMVILGDLAYNTYAEKYKFWLNNSKSHFTQLKPTTSYFCIGNHDNNISITGDWEASADYRSLFGPTYYSFNAGGVHYIILDNIVYKNTTDDPNGYDCDLTSDIRKWIKKDLANVSKTTPVIVGMHAPLFKRQQVDANGKLNSVAYRYNFSSNLYNTLNGYNVKVFTGHSHANRITTLGNLSEHGVGCAGGDLYWPGKFNAGNIVCSDGSPASYRVMEVTDGDLRIYNKSIGYDRNYQFRAYDLNNCNITNERFCPNYTGNYGTLEDILATGEGKELGYNLRDYNSDGTPKTPNQIMVKVFTFGPTCKIEMFEEGTPLTVKRISGYDPYFIISDLCQRLQNGNKPGGYPMQDSSLFVAQAKSATSTITIKFTDENGDVFVEKMKRPKEFSIANYKIGSSENQVSSVNEIYGNSFDTDSDAPVEYYNLQGVRVENPASGLFIKRQGTKATKILIP